MMWKLRLIILFLIYPTLNIFSAEATLEEHRASGKPALIISSFSFESPIYRKILEELRAHKRLLLITPEGEMPESKKAEYSRYFDSIVTINDKDYSDSGAVEHAAIGLFHTIGFDRIIPTMEREILAAGRLRTLLGIEGQDYRSALAFRDKVIMKGILANKGIRVPKFRPLDSYSDLHEFSSHQGLPLVVKPRRGAGSEKTYVLRTPTDLERMSSDTGIFNLLHSGGYEAEEFIDGDVYHVNGIIANGKISHIWPSAYINQCIDLTSSRVFGSHLLEPSDPRVPRLIAYATLVLETLPTPPDTAFHLEAFISKTDEIVLCEVASRVGGVYVRDDFIEAFGVNLSSLWWKMQAGLPIDDELSRGSTIPSSINGWLVYPTRIGKLLDVPTVTPFPWVLNYWAPIPIGTTITSVNQIEDSSLVTAMFDASTVKEAKERFQLLLEWLDANVKWEN